MCQPHSCSQVNSVNPNVYVNAIICASTFISFYGYLLFYKATKSALRGYGLRAKFVCIIAVLPLCGLQSGILETMGALEIIPCTPPFSVLTRSQRKSQHVWSLLLTFMCSLLDISVYRQFLPFIPCPVILSLQWSIITVWLWRCSASACMPAILSVKWNRVWSMFWRCPPSSAR